PPSIENQPFRKSDFYGVARTSSRRCARGLLASGPAVRETGTGTATGPEPRSESAAAISTHIPKRLRAAAIRLWHKLSCHWNQQRHESLRSSVVGHRGKRRAVGCDLI